MMIRKKEKIYTINKKMRSNNRAFVNDFSFGDNNDKDEDEELEDEELEDEEFKKIYIIIPNKDIINYYMKKLIMQEYCIFFFLAFGWLGGGSSFILILSICLV